MGGSSARENPSKGQAGLDDLPRDVLERIAELGFSSQVSPPFDRGDLLCQACTLACVGNTTCTALAQLFFAALSPRLGGYFLVSSVSSAAAALTAPSGEASNGRRRCSRQPVRRSVSLPPSPSLHLFPGTLLQATSCLAA